MIAEIKKHWIENIWIDPTNVPTSIEVARLWLSCNKAPVHINALATSGFQLLNPVSKTRQNRSPICRLPKPGLQFSPFQPVNPGRQIAIGLEGRYHQHNYIVVL